MNAELRANNYDQFTNWDAYSARKQAEAVATREWWSDAWDNFWKPIGDDWADNPGHASRGRYCRSWYGGGSGWRGAKGRDGIESHRRRKSRVLVRRWCQ